ncbi:hypothetical protein P4S83_01720 [Aneurinibacillus thermoaerophilus]|uniref:hypothetical protein n=1 Tax=Aneurinibacillus thermoaerophilus TaxID=143495 RepID=UPI002E1DDFB6|nr:hypothetical protein [Aneurinibacillus thermoaerophilus]
MYKYIKEVDNLIEGYIAKINSEQFYKYKIIRFFEEYMGLPHNTERPLNSIHAHDIETYLKTEKIKKDALNHYNALKSFFDYTFKKGDTQDVMRTVKKPDKKAVKKKYLSDEEIKLIAEFIQNKNNKLIDRMLLGFFLYTGLSRKYIAELTNSHIYIDDKEQTLQINNHILPLKKELVEVIKEYRGNQKPVRNYKRIFGYDANYVTSKLKELTLRIINRESTPTEFSNTFIKSCLNAKGEIDVISGLVSESMATVIKHIETGSEEYEEEMYKKMAELLDRIY